MSVHLIQPAVYAYTFGISDPIARVHSGNTVIAETRDAFGYDAHRTPLPEEMKQRIPGTTLKESNPVVGPIYIEEAEEGDLLAVHIRRIRLTRDFAISQQSPHFGSLTGEGLGHHLLYNEPIPAIKYEWQLDLTRNVGIFEMPNSGGRCIEVPLQPFLGSIGVAPRFGRCETTLTPGEYGGNMDCVETKEGTILYLPVWVKGAYFSFGDVHALQGDGEVNGTALEVTAEVTLDLEVIKGKAADWPRLEDAYYLMVAGSARPLMECVALAQLELLRWLVDEHGFQREEAWQLMAQVGTMRIGNVVDPKYTVVAKFPKRYL